MQFLVTGHLDEGHAQLSAVLKAVGMTLPETPRGVIVSLVLNRIKIRLRGLHFRPRNPSQVFADDLTRIEVCWTAANGLGMIDPIRSSDFQARSLLPALKAGEPYRIGRAICTEASYVSFAGRRASRRVSKLVRIAEEIAKQVDHPHIWGGVFAAKGVAAYMTGRWKPAVRAARPGSRHFPHALHRSHF